MSKCLTRSSLEEIKYIIIFEYGQLGNQFFQYLAVRTAVPKARIICIGLQSLRASLQASSCYFPPSKKTLLLKNFFTILGRDRALGLAKRRRLLGLISEIRTEGKSSISLVHGCFNKVAVLDGFFQAEAFIEKASSKEYPLNVDLLYNARKWIHDNIIARGLNAYFFHLRRGDYVRWPTPDHPAVLPFQWYEQQMNEIVQADPRAHFIVCTDDRPYAEERLGLNPLVTISRGSEIEDFFVMTQCSGGGILSASSFSWWASWYGRQFFPSSRYIAPLYWVGWRLGQWYPPAIETTWLDYRIVR